MYTYVLGTQEPCAIWGFLRQHAPPPHHQILFRKVASLVGLRPLHLIVLALPFKTFIHVALYNLQNASLSITSFESQKHGDTQALLSLC